MFNDAESFLQESMDRHKALKTFRARVAWNLTFNYEGTWQGSDPTPRTIVYAAPNRFRIQHGDARLNHLYLCDGKSYQLIMTGFQIPGEQKDVPTSLATSDLVDSHPHFGGSFLYALFGGRENLPLLLGKKNPGTVRFEADSVVEGEPCKTVVFGGGTYYKERRVWISVKDGLVRQVEGSDDPKPLGPEALEENRKQLREIKANPAWKHMTPAQQATLTKRFTKTMTPAARTVETLSELVVNQPIADNEFTVEVSPEAAARNKAEAERLSRGIVQKLGDPAPAFRATVLADGRPLNLAELKGKVVLIDLWATWCGPCVRGLPETLALQKAYERKGVVVLAVSDEDKATVTGFLKANKKLAGLNAVLSPDASKSFGVRAIPTVVVVGRDSKIAAAFVGLQSPQTLRAALDKALAAR
ncbi:TlpA family protein disulfide reductase [Armatimonas rosea]|uniref:Thiol-disulfide isomerase/thioredoxin n=1 Tax=Armatimonas rosea TaxID=685828 RepID=A0A7W9W7T0_ARMRO|nr:redoxin family protein [Armatimonas rosea]MBB6051541.1 thiol-disulfide isomerase/thioredoxin [Armatimonas rosea]